MVLTGPSLPLWFLPFIYVANGLATLYVIHCSRFSGWFEAVALIGLAIGCTVLGDIWSGIPISQWLLGASAVFVAISIFRAQTEPKYLVVAGLILSAVALRYPSLQANMLLLAFLVASVAILWPLAWKSAVARQLGAISLGVYLLHSGVLAVIGMLFKDLPAVTEVFVVVILSSAIAWALRYTRVLGNFI